MKTAHHRAARIIVIATPRPRPACEVLWFIHKRPQPSPENVRADRKGSR